MGRNRAFDTSHLIRQWRRRRPHSFEGVTKQDAESWADELIALHKARAICTPIRIEFLCNTSGKAELQRAREFLERFEVVAREDVTRQDWIEAAGLAPRRATDRKHERALGDCLIAAFYRRLNLSLIPIQGTDQDLVRRIQAPKKREESS